MASKKLQTDKKRKTREDKVIENFDFTADDTEQKQPKKQKTSTKQTKLNATTKKLEKPKKMVQQQKNRV
jgi:hypothetical protein